MADLARALVAAPWWGWREGMRLWRERPFSHGPEAGRVVLRDGRLSVAWENGALWEPAASDWPTYQPDVTDAATAGILLDMLSEEQSGISLHEDADEEGDSLGWYVRTPLRWGSRLAGEGPTLGEAAARALLEVRGG